MKKVFVIYKDWIKNDPLEFLILLPFLLFCALVAIILNIGAFVMYPDAKMEKDIKKWNGEKEIKTVDLDAPKSIEESEVTKDLKDEFNLFVSMHNAIVFDSRDWGQNKKDAWLYGIVVGWNGDNEEENESLYQEFNKKFKWDRDTWNRLQVLNKEFLRQKEMCK